MISLLYFLISVVVGFFLIDMVHCYFTLSSKVRLFVALPLVLLVCKFLFG